MDRDGKNKRDLTKDSKEFAYGFSASKDGRRIAYHKSYQVYVADADGSNARQIATGHPFNFAPQWSPDGTHLLFVAGEHYNCHPYVANADGTGLRKLADRGGYRGVIAFLDVPDFHGGSSDIPAWSADGTIGLLHGPGRHERRAVPRRARRPERTPDADPGRLAPLPPDALAGRPLAGLWIEAGRRPATLRHAARGPVRASAHRPARTATRPCGRTGNRCPANNRASCRDMTPARKTIMQVRLSSLTGQHRQAGEPDLLSCRRNIASDNGLDVRGVCCSN